MESMSRTSKVRQHKDKHKALDELRRRAIACKKKAVAYGSGEVWARKWYKGFGYSNILFTGIVALLVTLGGTTDCGKEVSTLYYAQLSFSTLAVISAAFGRFSGFTQKLADNHSMSGLFSNLASDIAHFIGKGTKSAHEVDINNESSYEKYQVLCDFSTPLPSRFFVQARIDVEEDSSGWIKDLLDDTCSLSGGDKAPLEIVTVSEE
uniref:Uncharacterized protein n=1 Tax=Pithovirus LCPAC404 TaxID=2506597 RepID=A0A481ZDI2_9VIRU|nr:MAG: uncharacterized protein LCPAC404_00760 [Pithovirus LCPAC404]